MMPHIDPRRDANGRYPSRQSGLPPEPPRPFVPPSPAPPADPPPFTLSRGRERLRELQATIAAGEARRAQPRDRPQPCRQ